MFGCDIKWKIEYFRPHLPAGHTFNENGEELKFFFNTEDVDLILFDKLDKAYYKSMKKKKQKRKSNRTCETTFF